MRAKSKFVRTIFPKQKAQTFARRDWREFFGQNKHWLAPYAAFCVLRDKFGTPDFNQWPDYRVYRANEIAALIENDSVFRGEIELNYFIQFHLHLQLRDATEYARER